MPIMLLLLLLLLQILMVDEVPIVSAGNSTIRYGDYDKQWFSSFSLLLMQLINRADDDVNVAAEAFRCRWRLIYIIVLF